MTTCRRTIANRRIGFTLIELLVAVGIIALLISILTPTVMYAISRAQRQRLAGDMVTISNALEAYKADFHDYPQVTQPNTGFAVLGQALLGPYGDGFLPGSTSATPDDPNDPPSYSATTVYHAGDCVQTGLTSTYVAISTIDNYNIGRGVGDPNCFAAFNPRDHSDGFGTRLSVGGKKVGPYVQPEKFRIHGCAFCDSNDKPILYFYAKHAKPNLSVPLASAGNVAPFISQTSYSLFNANDNLFFFERFIPPPPPPDLDTTRAIYRMAVLLGDMDSNGMIANGETAASTGPFLLWAPGPDGLYGPKTAPGTTPTASDAIKCDDVTNFRQ